MDHPRGDLWTTLAWTILTGGVDFRGASKMVQEEYYTQCRHPNEAPSSWMLVYSGVELDGVSEG